MSSFPDITLLVTHFNRSESLGNLLEKLAVLNCQFGSIVISDDGSDADHLKKLNSLRDIYSFRLIKAPTNKGLGNNINKGQDAVNTPYTLYIQEDFEPTDKFPMVLESARKMMVDDASFDYIRFYAYFQYPYIRSFTKDFSEMYFVPLGLDYNKIYMYTDHPHLRRTDFLKKFGRYEEGIKGDRTEYQMCISFIRNGGRGLVANDFTELLVQRNSIEEPSTMHRTSWKSSNGLLLKVIRYLYRQIRYNYDLLRP